MRAIEFIYERSLKQRVADEDYDPNGPPPGPEFKPTMPKGTVKVDVSDVYDWYKLGQHISNLKGLGKHDFGSGPPSTIMAFGDEDTEHKYIDALQKTGLTTTDIDPVDPNQPKGMKRQKVDPTYNVNEYDESVSDPKKDPEAYKAYLLKTLPFIMSFLNKVIKDWRPTEEQMLDAIDIAYETMKDTGDVKVAGKAFQDHLQKLHKMSQDVTEGTGNISWQRYEHESEFVKQIPREYQDPVDSGDGTKGEFYDKNDQQIGVFVRDDFREYDGPGQGAYWGPKTSVSEGRRKKKRKSAKSVRGYFFPGYAYYGIGNSGEEGGDGGGGESINRKIGEDASGGTINFKVNKGKNKFATELLIDGKSAGVYQYNAETGRSIAEIFPEYRGQGLGKLLVLHAIYTAAKLGLDFLEDESRTAEYNNVLDSLSSNGYVVDDEGYWYVTGEGERFLKGALRQGIRQDTVDEMALASYKTMGDFTKPGPFTGPDKKLVPHPKNIEKATRFFEQTPYDFRLFFSNVPGTGKYSEYGPMTPENIKTIFKDQAEEILKDSGDAITVVYVGNKGDSKVMLTPWMMAHRFGHAIQAGARNKNWHAWAEAEKYFFQTVNSVLEEHYGKVYRGANTYNTPIKWDMTPEYNALFNALGTQRSSRSNQIKRPYEFLYEIFAQYLGTGKVTFNPLPTNLGYGRRVFGNPTKYLNIKPEFRDESERKQAADSLAYTMELLFNDVLSDSVGKIFVM